MSQSLSPTNSTGSNSSNTENKSSRVVTTATDADKRIITFDPEAHTFYSIQHKDLVAKKKQPKLKVTKSLTNVDLDPSTSSANCAAFSKSAPLARNDWAARKASFLSASGSVKESAKKSKCKELAISIPTEAENTDKEDMNDLESGESKSSVEEDEMATSETTAHNTRLNAKMATSNYNNISTPRSGTSMNLQSSLELADKKTITPQAKKKSIAFAVNDDSAAEDNTTEEVVASTNSTVKSKKSKKNRKSSRINSGNNSLVSGISNQVLSNMMQPFNQYNMSNYGSARTSATGHSQVHPHDSISQYNPPSMISGYTDFNKNRGVCKSSTHCYLLFVAILCNVISVFYMVYIPLQVNYRYESFAFFEKHKEKAEMRKEQMSNWERPHATEIIAELVRGYEMIAPYHGCDGNYGCSEGHKGVLGSIPSTLSSIFINVCDLAFMLVLGSVAYMICSKRFEDQPKSKSGLFLAQVVSSWFYLFYIIIVNVVALILIKPQHEALEQNIEKLAGVKGYDEQLMDTYNYCRRSIKSSYKEDARNAHWLHFEINRYLDLARETPMLYRHLGFAYVQRGLLFFTSLMLYSLLVFCSHRALRKFKKGQKDLKERTRNEQMQAHAIKSAMLSHNTAFFLNAYSPNKEHDNGFNGQGGFGWGGFQNPLLIANNNQVAQQHALHYNAAPVPQQQQRHEFGQNKMQQEEKVQNQVTATPFREKEEKPKEATMNNVRL